jgi:serine/threonine-protein kinase HipA
LPISSRNVENRRLRTRDGAQIEELLLGGTSMGGARPKAVVEDEYALWIAKFNRPDDRWNSPRVEHAMLVLGRACGLVTAESKVLTIGSRDVLMVKRFDREKVNKGYLRASMVSGLTLLRAEDTTQARDRWSYVLLAEELRRVSAEPKKDAAELFRRMCFNAVISNTDDRPRNHAVIARDRDWRLSRPTTLFLRRRSVSNTGISHSFAGTGGGTPTSATSCPKLRAFS